MILNGAAILLLCIFFQVSSCSEPNTLASSAKTKQPSILVLRLQCALQQRRINTLKMGIRELEAAVVRSKKEKRKAVSDNQILKDYIRNIAHQRDIYHDQVSILLSEQTKRNEEVQKLRIDFQKLTLSKNKLSAEFEHYVEQSTRKEAEQRNTIAQLHSELKRLREAAQSKA